jgi:hypothetical protein
MYTVIWVLGCVALAVAVVVLGWKVGTWTLAYRERRWQEAVGRAKWEATSVSKDGKALVVVRKVARLGRESKVLDQHFVGSVAWDRPDYVQELLGLELEATTRAIQLNAGAVT